MERSGFRMTLARDSARIYFGSSDSQAMKLKVRSEFSLIESRRIFAKLDIMV